MSVCFDYSKEMEIAIGAIGGDSALRLGVVVIGLILVMVEAQAYFSIFKYLTNHDKFMINILPANAIARRKNQNAINLSGHSIHFVLDIIALILSVVHRWMSDASHANLRIFGLANFGLSGILCIASNNGYRKAITDMLDSLFHRAHQGQN